MSVHMICLCVVTTMSPTKLAEPIKLLSEKRTTNYVLHGSTYRRHMVNTTEQSKTAAMQAVATITVAPYY